MTHPGLVIGAGLAALWLMMHKKTATATPTPASAGGIQPAVVQVQGTPEVTAVTNQAPAPTAIGSTGSVSAPAPTTVSAPAPTTVSVPSPAPAPTTVSAPSPAPAPTTTTAPTTTQTYQPTTQYFGTGYTRTTSTK